MHILVFGKLSEDEVFDELLKKEQPYSVAQLAYEKALYDELKTNSNLDIDMVTIFQTGYYPEDSLIVNKNKKNRDFFYIPFINLPFLKELSFFIVSVIKILTWYKSIGGSQFAKIYSNNHYPPVSLAIVLVSKLLDIDTVGTFTDLSGFTYSEQRIKEMKFYKKIVIRPYLKLVKWLESQYSQYILFSEPMNRLINKKDKPYIVIEGIFNDENLNFQPKKTLNAITHAGTLNVEVGIQKIIDVFLELGREDYDLWFIGNGDMVETIIEYTKEYENIKYLGFIPKEEVFERLKESKLLVNLRDPIDSYTKYSFPSKMFEYMASGTPVLTTVLEGIPDEYYSYVYSIDSYETKDIANYLNNILDDPDNLGEEAREFVLNKKNSRAQAEKIVDFISNC